MPGQAQLLPGTLDLLILRAISLGPLHGYGILLRIAQISDNAPLVEQGALYPGLFRLVRQGSACCARSDPTNSAGSHGITPRARLTLHLPLSPTPFI